MRYDREPHCDARDEIRHPLVQGVARQPLNDGQLGQQGLLGAGLAEGAPARGARHGGGAVGAFVVVVVVGGEAARAGITAQLGVAVLVVIWKDMCGSQGGLKYKRLRFTGVVGYQRLQIYSLQHTLRYPNA